MKILTNSSGPEMNFDLDAEEAQLIQRHRKEKEKSVVTKALQDLCSHPDWKYCGHGHNDDCYKCIDCGLMEWR